MNLVTYFRAIARKDEGQDLLEYALLVALIAIVCVVVVGQAGESVVAIFDKIKTELTAALA